MSRRKNTDADLVVDFVSLFPWWVGVGIAVASYLILHAVALQPLPEAFTSIKQAGSFATSALWIWLAKVGQYVIPVLALFGALLSAIKRTKRNVGGQSSTKAQAPLSAANSHRNNGAPLRNDKASSLASRTSQNNEAKPACPVCGGDMVQRTSRRGGNAGNAFWGCTNYPKCRGVLPIE